MTTTETSPPRLATPAVGWLAAAAMIGAPCLPGDDVGSACSGGEGAAEPGGGCCVKVAC